MTICCRVQDHPFSYIPGDEILVIAPAGRGISSPIYNPPAFYGVPRGYGGGHCGMGIRNYRYVFPSEKVRIRNRLSLSKVLS
jgi:hypothetical protein